ncbi:MAG: serine/threonine protein kinase [Planctomycetota bacterium]|jgi:serine/threonine-protein kinase
MTLAEGDKMDRWQHIEELFHAALKMPVSERSAYLSSACEDARIRTEVDRLLKAHARADGFLRTAPVQDRNTPDELAMVGRRVGPYRLVEYVARGGMGAVYRAQRADEEFEHQVAIKLVNRWMVTALVRRRFVRERQTLAHLEHSGITRLLDGGTTEDGIPYLVMEYVAGLPIDAYCAERGLTVADRLGLFCEVCEVVAYAHRNLVVHRDLKPGNILVTEEGRPKLLDFGIAKVLAGTSDASATNGTLQQMRALTPQYASPEQIRGEPVTTAADVYSLGVVLYELVSGRQPYRLTGRSTYEEERKICETDPKLPSDAVMRGAGGAGDGEDDGRDRQLPEPPGRLRRRLRGDLDAIVMKAMQKQPARRYDSVTALADDVARHLNGQPIRARHHSMGYRAAKFIRRNIVAVAAVAIVALSVVGGGVAASIGLMREARAHRLAQNEAAEAEAINRFLNEMLSSVDPGKHGRDVRVTEILERAADNVGSLFGDRPEVQAALRTTIGKSFRALGMLEPAAVQLEKALALRESQRGAEHRETLESLCELGLLRTVQGDLSAAEGLLERALKSGRRVFGETSEELLSIRHGLAGLRVVQGRFPEAEVLLRQVLDAQRQTLGETHPNTIRTIHNLALVLNHQDKDEQAEAYCRRALDLHTQVHGPDHIHTIRAKGNLGNLLMERGDLDEAEPLVLGALEGDRRLLGDEHPETIIALHNVAVLRQYQGRDAEALALARDALEAAETSLPRGHLKIGRYRDHLGTCLTALGRFAEAERELLAAYDSLRGQLGGGHPYTQKVVADLIDLYEAWGKPAQAAEWKTRLDEIEVDALSVP